MSHVEFIHLLGIIPGHLTLSQLRTGMPYGSWTERLGGKPWEKQQSWRDFLPALLCVFMCTVLLYKLGAHSLSSMFIFATVFFTWPIFDIINIMTKAISRVERLPCFTYDYMLFPQSVRLILLTLFYRWATESSERLVNISRSHS